MQSLKMIMTMLCVPFLLATASLNAADVEAQANAEVESKKPSLTYYYFDG